MASFTVSFCVLNVYGHILGIDCVQPPKTKKPCSSENIIIKKNETSSSPVLWTQRLADFKDSFHDKTGALWFIFFIFFLTMAAASWICPRQKRIDNRLRRAGEWDLCISQVMLFVPTGDRKHSPFKTFYRRAKVKHGFKSCETDLLALTSSQMEKPDHVTLFNPTDCGQRKAKLSSSSVSAEIHSAEKWKSVFGCEKCMSVHELCWQQIKKKKRDNTTLTRWTGSFSNRVNWRSVKSLHVQTQSWGKYGCFQWNAVFF